MATALQHGLDSSCTKHIVPSSFTHLQILASGAFHPDEGTSQVRCISHAGVITIGHRPAASYYAARGCIVSISFIKRNNNSYLASALHSLQELCNFAVNVHEPINSCDHGHQSYTSHPAYRPASSSASLATVLRANAPVRLSLFATLSPAGPVAPTKLGDALRPVAPIRLGDALRPLTELPMRCVGLKPVDDVGVVGEDAPEPATLLRLATMLLTLPAGACRGAGGRAPTILGPRTREASAEDVRESED